MAAAAVQHADKRLRSEFTLSEPQVNVSLTRIARPIWAQTFSYLTIISLVEDVGRTCKYFRLWAGDALEVKAKHPHHASDGSGIRGFHRFLQAMKFLRGETLTWEQFGTKYFNRTTLSFRRVLIEDPGFMRAVVKCAPTLQSFSEDNFKPFLPRYDTFLDLLQAAPELQHVQLTSATHKSCEALLACRNLKSLTFSCCKFYKDETAAQFEASLTRLLSSSITLTALHQDVTDVTEDFLKALARQKDLTALTLGARISYGAYYAHMCGHPTEPIAQQLVRTLSVLSKLESLSLKQTAAPCLDYLSDKSYVSDAALEAVATSCTNLTSLTLENCVHVTPQPLGTILQKCTRLAALSLTQLLFDPPLGHEPDIGMTWAPCRQIVPLDGEFLKVIGLHKGALKTLRVSSRAITDSDVIHLANGCKQLVELDLSGKPLRRSEQRCSVTEASLSLLINARALGNLPQLSRLVFRDTEMDDLTEFSDEEDSDVRMNVHRELIKSSLDLMKSQVSRFTLITTNDRYDIAHGKVTSRRA